MGGVSFIDENNGLYFAFLEGCLNDFYIFDTNAGTWTKISGDDNTPVPRMGHGFTSANKRLYLFSGKGDGGTAATA